MKSVVVRTGTGKARLYPLICEVTGKQIGWQAERESDSTNAFLSFEVVDEEGTIKMSSKLLEINTF